MRIAELSRTSGVPVPSIKYYLRAGLLPPGERTAPNQADYTEKHLHRLKLIRALIEVGGLSIAAVGDLLTSLDARGDNLNEAVGTAIKATLPATTSSDSGFLDEATRLVHRVLEKRGWQEYGPTQVETLISAVETFQRLGQPDIEMIIELYADLVERLVPKEIEWITTRDNTDAVVEAAIIGTFIGGRAFSALRSLGHEAESRKRLPLVRLRGEPAAQSDEPA